MPDLEAALLNAVLGFARSRLEELLTSLVTDAESMLLALIPGATQAQRDAVAAQAVRDGVAADLAAANQHLTQLAADLGGPPQNLDQAEAAFNELAALFTAVDAAVAKVATVVPEVGTVEQALIALVKKAVAAVGDGVSGLVDQLGLGPGGASLSDGLASSRPAPCPPRSTMARSRPCSAWR